MTKLYVWHPQQWIPDKFAQFDTSRLTYHDRNDIVHTHDCNCVAIYVRHELYSGWCRCFSSMQVKR